MEIYSEEYKSRCLKRLKEWNAPLQGWYCISVSDTLEEDTGLFTCELCGCVRVRFVHVMRHDQYFEDVSVGCICAGIMEGDILAAKERERLVRNRARRRANFPYRKWRKGRRGGLFLNHKGASIIIWRSDGLYWASYKKQSTRLYKGKPITNYLSAIYAAFDLVDPPIRGQRL